MTQTKKRISAYTKRTVSVLLALLMLISVFSALDITVSAVEKRNIYYQNTNNYSTVYAYAWDTTNNNAEMLGGWPGTAMERLGTSNYYKVSVDPSANKIIFSNGSNSNQTANLDIPTYNNPMYNGTWQSDFDDSEYTGSGEVIDPVTGVDAVAGHNFGSGIYAANATYFDYMSDQEITDGYLYPFEAGTNFDGAIDHWYPFYRFNRAIKVAADNNSSWTYPLYFGNFCNVGGAYWDYDNNRVNTHGGDFANATNSGNVTRFHYFANNSNRDYIDHTNNNNFLQIGITAENEVVQGLVQNKLNNGNIMATPTMKLPYFDSEFLRSTYLEKGTKDSSGTRIAQVFKSYFPFVENNSNGYTTYRFDSTNAKDNVYFTWNGKVPTAVNYGAGSGFGVRDGLKKFMGNQEAGYGIFPFNNASDTNKGNRNGNNCLDYGFGVRIDIDFRVTETGTVDGTSNGTPITFNFSGDDDIWVFISDDNGNENLVLDLGGNHKMASGSIDFKYMTATANRVYSKTNNNSKGQQTVSFNGGNKLSSKKTYHMTVFYMERGLIESNFQMNFSFYPLDNLLTTEKFVETANVNNGIKTEVAKVDDFTITNKANNAVVANKEYMLDGVKTNTDSNGSYRIKNGQIASFTNIAKTGSTLNVTESIPTDSAYEYTTKYIVTDVENSKKVKDGSTLSTGDFVFQNTVSTNNMTNFNVAFYNTPKTSNISLAKTALKDGTAITSSMDFPFTILLDLDGDGTKYSYAPYPLEYKLSGDSVTTYVTTSDGKFSIQSGQKAVFSGIPVNAKYKIVEEDNDELYISDKTNNTVEGTVLATASSNSVTFTNTMVSNEPTVVQLKAEKLLDGQSDFKEIFSFNLQEVDAQGNKIGSAQTKQNANKFGTNTIEFDSINVTRVDTGNNFTLQDMYIYGNGSTGSAWMNGENNNLTATKNKMTKVAEGVYEITFNNVSAGSYYKYRFSANGSSEHTWDSTGAFNGSTDTTVAVAKDNSTVKLRIDVSDFSFKDNSGNVTVSYTVTPPNETSNSIYLKNTKNWSTPYIYYWSDANTSMVGWPGKAMQNVSGNIYKYDVPTDAQYVIFNIGSNSDQTGNLSAKFGYIYDNSTGSWSEYDTPAEVVEYTKTTYNQSNGATDEYTYKRYFEISEVNNSCTSEGVEFVYDQTKHYAVITVKQTATKIEAKVEYYKTLESAVNGNKSFYEDKVTFRNYHKGRMRILKEDINGNPINDDVVFSLYKVSGDGVNIEGLTPIKTQEINGGEAVFDNLDLFVNQSTHDVSTLQWYCVVESVPKDGYMINASKHYFVIPEVELSQTAEYDIQINNKKYSYVLKNGEKIYDIEYTVVNAPLVMPHTSGSGTAKYVYTGIAVMALGVAVAGVYVGINRRKRRKCKVQ